MHKDLSDFFRGFVEDDARDLVAALVIADESLAIAREAWLNTFDKAAQDVTDD